MIKPGEEIIAGKNEHFRMVDVVLFEEVPQCRKLPEQK